MTKRIIAYALFLLGFVIFAFFSQYKGEVIHYNFIFWIVGGAMWIGGFIILRSAPTFKEENKNKEVLKMIAEIKANGTPVTVDFSICEIKENKYTEEGNSNLNDNFYFIKPNFASDKTVMANVNQSVIVFPYNEDGKEETFVSNVINKDKITLLFELTSKKTTTLYIDPNNRSRYYFDLDFLN